MPEDSPSPAPRWSAELLAAVVRNAAPALLSQTGRLDEGAQRRRCAGAALSHRLRTQLALRERRPARPVSSEGTATSNADGSAAAARASTLVRRTAAEQPPVETAEQRRVRTNRELGLRAREEARKHAAARAAHPQLLHPPWLGGDDNGALSPPSPAPPPSSVASSLGSGRDARSARVSASADWRADDDALDEAAHWEDALASLPATLAVSSEAEVPCHAASTQTEHDADVHANVKVEEASPGVALVLLQHDLASEAPSAVSSRAASLHSCVAPAAAARAPPQPWVPPVVCVEDARAALLRRLRLQRRQLNRVFAADDTLLLPPHAAAAFDGLHAAQEELGVPQLTAAPCADAATEETAEGSTTAAWTGADATASELSDAEVAAVSTSPAPSPTPSAAFNAAAVAIPAEPSGDAADDAGPPLSPPPDAASAPPSPPPLDDAALPQSPPPLDGAASPQSLSPAAASPPRSPPPDDALRPQSPPPDDASPPQSLPPDGAASPPSLSPAVASPASSIAGPPTSIVCDAERAAQFTALLLRTLAAEQAHGRLLGAHEELPASVLQLLCMEDVAEQQQVQRLLFDTVNEAMRLHVLGATALTASLWRHHMAHLSQPASFDAVCRAVRRHTDAWLAAAHAPTEGERVHRQLLCEVDASERAWAAAVQAHAAAVQAERSTQLGSGTPPAADTTPRELDRAAD